MTRRTADLLDLRAVLALLAALTVARLAVNAWLDPLPLSGDEAQDRKSTRLNSSHYS